MTLATRLFVVLSIATAAARLDAQVLYGSLVGNVTDPSEAAVPNATVTVVNPATGQSREMATDERGFYAFRDLQGGSYDLKVVISGFMTYTRTGISVTINTVARVDVKMQVGQLTESVTVGALAVALQTDKADVHVDIGKKEISNLPLTGYRNYQSLLDLVPGATPGSYQNAMMDTPGRALTTNVNGAARNSNTTRLDGALNVFNWLPHHTLYTPPVESIETVNITTNSFDAEQGLAGGAAVSVSTKSGTNDVHGVMFEYHNNSSMAARNFFWLGAKIPKVIQNQYGGTLGGPIKKDKLFFFTSWEGMRYRFNASSILTVPTLEQRNGDFSATGVTIYDPATGTPDGKNRQPFMNNAIPAARQSQAALKMQALLPMPNQPGYSANYFTSASAMFNRDNGDVKVNYNATSKLAVWGKYSIMDASVSGQPQLGAAGGDGLGTSGHGTAHTLVQVAAIGFTNTFSPTFVVDGTVGFSRLGQYEIPADYGKNFGLDTLGIPGTNGPDIRQSGQPIFAVSSYTSMGNTQTWTPMFRYDNTYTFSLNAGWTRGAHNVRFGFDLGRFQLNHWQPERGNGPRGEFDFNGQLTSLNGGAAPKQFNSWADFLLGMPSLIGKSYQVMSPMSTRDQATGLYLRDQWQVTRNFTANFGVRWEYYPIMHRASRGIERYDPSINKTLIGGRGSTPYNAGTTASHRLFAPRVGLAYRLGSNTVIRAGYGISIDPYPIGRPLRDNYPVVVSQQITPASYNNAGTLEAGIPPITFPDESAGVVNIPGTVATRALQAGQFPRGYIQSFNFTLQRQLPGGFAAQAGYVGTRSIRQMIYYELNAGQIAGAGLNGQPLYGQFGRTASTVLLMPFQGVNYNSLQAKLDRRVGGLTTTLAYTYSKTIDYQDNSTEGTWYFWLPSQMSRQRAVAGYDRTHNLQMATVWEVPFGKTKRYLNGGGVASAVLGGWQVNGVFSSFTGLPFTITASGASLNAPSNNQVADQVKPSVDKLGGIGSGHPYFDTTAFKAVTEARFGNTGRNTMRGPGAVNISAGLFRSFKLGERWAVQVRGEAMNLTNTPHFGNPNGSITSSSFGMITSTAGSASSLATDDSRLLRVGLRISF